MPKVLVLGAGASHGHGLTRVRRPPLASGFFSGSLGQTLKYEYGHLVRYLRHYLDIDVTAGSSIDIETVFARLEASWLLGYHRWPEVMRKYGPEFVSVNPLDMLRSFVTDMVYRSTRWLRRETCPFHRFLTKSWLHPGDTVVSFNYDLLFDVCLKRHTSWSETTGYGFVDAELCRNLEVEESDITLLKPHGSLNWFCSSRSLFRSWSGQATDPPEYDSIPVIRIVPLPGALAGKSLRAQRADAIRGVAAQLGTLFQDNLPDNYLQQNGFRLGVEVLGNHLEKNGLQETGFLPLMIMPTPNKPFSEMTFAELTEVWTKVRSALEKATEILAIGFSFRDDHFNQVLFESARTNRSALKLTIVTKEKDVFRAVQNRLRHSGIVLSHFDGLLSDYVATRRSDLSIT